MKPARSTQSSLYKTLVRYLPTLAIFLVCLNFAGASFAEDADANTTTNASATSSAQDNTVVAQKISDLKEKVIELNRNLFILQEELLFPAETQVAVFVSVDSGVFFKVDSIQLRLDNADVTHYLYTDHEREALQRGGVQRLWEGNIKSGQHELTAFFKGQDNEGRAIENAATLSFEKGDEASMLEIKIVDSNSDMRAHFSIKSW